MKEGFCAQQREKDTPQLQMRRPSAFKLLLSGVPRKLIGRAKRKFQLYTSAWRVLKRRLYMTSCKLQLVQQLQDTDRTTFALQCKLEHVSQKLANQFDVCHVNNRGHFKHF